MSRKRDARLTLTQSFICSSIAGFTSKTLTAPLDVVKIRTQVGTSDTRHGNLHTIRSMLQREGFCAFWKGNAIACLRLCPYSIIQLVTFQRLRTNLSDSCGRLSPLSALIAGSCAGLFATIVMYPTDTVKTRLIVQHSSPKWAHYGGIIHAFQTIITEEGIRAFYKGLSTTVIGSVFYTAAMFISYESMSEYQRKRGVSSTPAIGFVQGCIAAGVAQTVAYPMDTIRKKMQAYSLKLPDKGGVDIIPTSVRSAILDTIRQHGMQGLWKGLSVNMIRVVPYTGLMFYVFESCKKVLLYHNGYTLSPFQEIHHPLVDQNLSPQEIDDEEDTDGWMISEED